MRFGIDKQRIMSLEAKKKKGGYLPNRNELRSVGQEWGLGNY